MKNKPPDKIADIRHIYRFSPSLDILNGYGLLDDMVSSGDYIYIHGL
jgi:hypothetical protein